MSSGGKDAWCRSTLGAYQRRGQPRAIPKPGIGRQGYRGGLYGGSGGGRCLAAPGGALKQDGRHLATPASRTHQRASVLPEALPLETRPQQSPVLTITWRH